ncbi:ABC transporter permease [Caenibacillus caldisaponilyticus]|uniref:ABC transporter permease n=1 Tax=Caenibacillus caldisaponilyticus TaxID=1674942 RepID=UPI0009883659|nr:ABC transporter permease [Caenibacillus caldisaponilyticus]
MKAIIVKELKLMIKEKGNIFFLLIMPMLFMLMFGSLFNKGNDLSVEIHYVDQDHTALSQTFLKQLKKTDGIHLKNESSADLSSLINKIKKGQLASMLVINKGFEEAIKEGRQAQVKLYRDPAASSEVSAIEAVLKNIANGYREAKLAKSLTALGENKEQAVKTLTPPIQIQNINTTGEHIDYISQVVPGMTVMFIFYIMISMTKRFFKEKESGLLSRIQSTTMKPLPYLVGMWVPFVIAVIVQSIILLGFGHFVYHLKLGHLSALSMLIIGLSLCGTGVGLALSVLVRGENQGMAITQLIALAGAMVGGLWMPSYLLPFFIQNIGYFTPQYWALRGLQDIIVHGADVGDIWRSLAVLAAFGFAGLFVAVLRFPRFLKSATH